jgi:hypothetical protein
MITNLLTHRLNPNLITLLIIIRHVNLRPNLQQHTPLKHILHLRQTRTLRHHRPRPQPIPLLIQLTLLTARHHTLHRPRTPTHNHHIQQQPPGANSHHIVLLNHADIIDLLLVDHEVSVSEFDVGGLHILEELALWEDLFGHVLDLLFYFALEVFADCDDEDY